MKQGTAIAWVLIPCAAVMVLPCRGQEPQTHAREVLMLCVSAMGGADDLQQVETITYQSVEHTFFPAADISESLPGMVAYSRNDVVLQPQHLNIRDKFTSWRTESADQDDTLVIATPGGGFTEQEGKRVAFRADSIYGIADTLAANPIIALLAALHATDLDFVGRADQTYRLSFTQTIYGQPEKTTLGINSGTGLLDWIEIAHDYPGDIYSAYWGVTTKRYVFSDWQIEPSGLHFPLKSRILSHGSVEDQQSVFNLKLNSEVGGSTFDIPDEFKGYYAKALTVSPNDIARMYNHGIDKHLTVAEGVEMVPGREGVYNSFFVRQDKGIVIIEGPFSNLNSEYMIGYARKLFPNLPITSVVSTDQFWLHVGGLGAYAKAHIPIYVLESNVDLVRQMMASQGVSEKGAGAPRLRVIRGRTEIGTGTNRIVLIPFRGATSARMVAAYLPGLNLLYASDMYLPKAWGGPYWTEHLEEIRNLIDHEHLDVKMVAGISSPPYDWKVLAASIPGQAADKGAHKPS
jgi:hypothetical protein